ncbi:MAG: amidase, Asp-tRNAAsn/Glu-tRNAGln amidotransferase subunit [Ilumatobacteraceae bacterium]|nr:amidase, Asp-tRNAAsn/Glu-tRNAGln amidotransferase subunit [Ilumatobacteraceae bacterium]MCU1388189.1 amidase, Asp-tRNAAsn/Glu-tRNAGln amidotransferase subunit [Ilumatobacteraceae bacterium]
MSSLADDTRWMDATDQAALVASGDVSPSELLEAAIERIERIDPALNAVTIRWFDHAREVAADPALPPGPFHGVPFLIKDLWAAYGGQRISNGNVALRREHVISPADTTLVARYKAAGLVIAGRTNSPELGSVPTTEPVAWGATHNPWDLDRTPGGSSGGAAAAVAAGLVPFAHATDGGGSIRIPASCCGLVGLKPSQGRITFGPQRDESGLGVEHCVSRTVRDSAALLDATHGPGIGDTVIAPAPARPYLAEVGADPGRLRIGVLDHHPQGGHVDAECTLAANNAATLLESLGHDVERAWPAALEDASFGAQFGALWSANMGIALKRFEGMIGRPLADDEFEPMNRAQAEFASHFTSVEYALALAAVAQYRRAMQGWWADGWDLLLTPTLAEVPIPLGTIRNVAERPMDALARSGQFVPFTPPFNTSGQPAISLPLHWSAAGLPVGVQLVAAYGREDVLYRIAAQLEQAAPWAHRTPSI